MTSSSWACLRVVGDVDDEWRQRSLWAAGATGQSSLPACVGRACVWNTTSDAAAVDENYRCHHISFWCLVPAASAMAVYTYIQFSIHVNGFHGISFRYWHLLLIFSIQGAWSKKQTVLGLPRELCWPRAIYTTALCLSVWQNQCFHKTAKRRIMQTTPQNFSATCNARSQGHVTHFYILWPRPCLERMKLDISNLVCRLNVKSTTIIIVKIPQYRGVFVVAWPLKILGNKC